MEPAYKARVANLILESLMLRQVFRYATRQSLTYWPRRTLKFCSTFRPLTKSLGEVGFLHTDLWSNNLLKKDNAIIAIDFETATTGALITCFSILKVIMHHHTEKLK